MTERRPALPRRRRAGRPLLAGTHRGPIVAAALFVAMFALFVTKHPAGLQRQRRQHRGEQGRAARARRDGADPPGPDRWPRSLGRQRVRDGELPRLDPDGRRRRSRSRSASSIVLASGLVCGAINGLDRRATGGCSRSSRPWRPARSTTGSRCCCGRRPAATSTRTSPTSMTGSPATASRSSIARPARRGRA